MVSNLNFAVEQFPGIASVFTYNWKGREILRKINSGFKVYLDLQKASHCQTEEPRFGPTPSVLISEIDISN